MMDVTIAFFVGLIVGGCGGIFCLALMSAADAREEDLDDDR